MSHIKKAEQKLVDKKDLGLTAGEEADLSFVAGQPMAMEGRENGTQLIGFFLDNKPSVGILHFKFPSGRKETK